ncbi:MAG: hypothetical protein K0R61_511 [Microvirga sp.]|jgi:hypothetical protein|nr:hypothetical protein [Microvirga sp.]MDF2970061.1 hypothetical protein [Microvirga sp.]
MKLCVFNVFKFMNTCCSGRSPRPARLFSFGLLDGPQVRLCRPHVQEAHGKGRVLARLGWAGDIRGFGLSRFATAFVNNPG